jgi:DNA invertase Pin-like site-specific DNA recombinase
VPRRKGGSLLAAKFDFASVKDILVPYRRVSTREQAESGAGLAAQTTTITHGLAFRQQTALTWDCVDEGKSGKNLKRPNLELALEHIRAGRAGGLIVSKLDRLSRSLSDFAILMDTAEREGWNIVCLDVNLDLMSPMGKFVAGILALFAQFEREVIRQRTLDGLAEKRAEGVKLGRRRSVDDDLLKTIVGAWQEKQSWSKVAQLLNDGRVPTPAGGKMWYPSAIQRVVQSPDGQALIRKLEVA